jgi:predicted amidohydrolase YtcJ
VGLSGDGSRMEQRGGAAVATTYINAKVFTGRAEDDFASAFTVADGRFTWVGDRPPAGEGAGGEGAVGEGAVGEGAVVDLAGATVLPGLLDVHTHPSLIAMTLGAVACTPPRVTSIEQMIEALAASDAHGRGPDVWIEGWGYDEAMLAEGRAPTALDLDRVSRTQPVHVLRSDCHSGVCNTRALELAGITAATPDPPGGSFGRLPDGRPDGVLTEHGANDVVMRAKARSDLAGEVARVARCGRHFAERGIVAATEMMAGLSPFDSLQVLRAAQEHGLVQQVHLYYEWTQLREHGTPDLSESQRTGRVRVAGVKVFMDGSVSNRTAWVSEPYPGTSSYGMRTLDDDELRAATAYARRNHVQLAVHVMGDQAIAHVIDLLGDEAPWLVGRPSVRLEHATLLTPALIARMNEARMHFGVASQIIFFHAEQSSYAHSLSPLQYTRAYATRTAYESLPDYALSSDRPATTWDDPDDVFVSIRAAVTRRAHNGADIVADQAITVPQAVLLYTGRARALVDFAGVGTIEVGNEASFVVLDRDVFTIDPEQIDRVRIARCYLAGQLLATAPDDGP